MQANEERHVSERGPDAFEGAGQTEGFSKEGGQSHSPSQPNCPGDSPTSGSKMGTEEGRVGGSADSSSLKTAEAQCLNNFIVNCVPVLTSLRRGIYTKQKKKKSIFFYA